MADQCTGAFLSSLLEQREVEQNIPPAPTGFRTDYSPSKETKEGPEDGELRIKGWSRKAEASSTLTFLRSGDGG